MGWTTRGTRCVGTGLMMAALAQSADAQVLDLFRGLFVGERGTQSSGSMANAAGIIDFCVRHSHLDGRAGSVRDQLLDKLGGGDLDYARQDRGYAHGRKGLLIAPNGNQLDLSRAEATSAQTRSVCERVLSQGAGAI